MANVRSFLLLLPLAVACAQDSSRAPENATTLASSSTGAPGAADRIAVAMSAAPAHIAGNATIMDFDARGQLVQLRAGNNGWLCFADDSPAAPGDSPNCLDQRWQEWFTAYEQKKVPDISGIGLAYMLQGSLSPSNTDPFAATPPAGAQWVKDGPHVMVIVPDPAALDAFSGNHMSGGPYVMYKGTPYAHLMVPVSAR
jgi:hypothetical protein